MKLKYVSTVLAFHFSLVLVACGPSTPPVNQPTGTPTASSTPGDSSTSVTPTPSPSPSGTVPTGTPTTPAPTSNPASGTSTTVTLPNGSKLVLSLGNRYLEAKGQTIQINATLTDASGAPLPLNTLKLLFSSSRPHDLSVSDSGLVTALVEQGFANISVMIEGTELKATQLVSVNSIEAGTGGGGGGSTPQPTATPLEDLDVDVEFEGLGVGEFLVNTYTTENQITPQIAMDSDGDFVVTWQSQGQDGSYYGVYAQRYNSVGTAQGAEFKVNTYTTSTQSRPSVAMDADGDFVVSWNSFGQDGGSYGIYAQRYNSMGVAQGSEFQVNTYTTGTQSRPVVSMDADGDFVVVWQSRYQDGSEYGIYAQRYNSAGAAQGSEFQVNEFTSNFQAIPTIVMDSDGDFIIAWHSITQDGDNSGIYAKRYNSAGTAQGSEFQVNTYTTSRQVVPDIAMDADGDFVITWTSSTQDSNTYGVYAQRYNSAGLAQGSEFHVNSYTTDRQLISNIAMDADGDFVVSWNSLGQDGSNYGIYAQRYNSLGTAQGSEFRINTYTTHSQNQSAIAMDADGDFVISWESRYQDGDEDGVYAKRYTAAGIVQ